MTRFCAALLLASVAFLALGFTARAQASAHTAESAAAVSETPESFVAELRELNRRLDPKHTSAQQIAAIRSSLPGSWEIQSGEQHYSVASRPLANILRRAEKNPDSRAKDIDAARAWLSDLRHQIDDYSALPPTSDAVARDKAKQILSRREFSGIDQQNPTDLLRRKINELEERFFRWLFSHLGRHPLATQTMFWAIVGAAVAWLAFMLFRFWVRGAKLESIEKIDTVTYRRPWQEWIRAAREAAARGDFREAVHCTYWAGIARLEMLGALAPDPARTPRESLRSLDNPNSNVNAATAEQRESLSVLTASLERFWYGRRSAAADDFQTCLRKAEELGCRV